MTPALTSRDRFIPWLFVLGFALVVAVNGVMIWFAVGSFSGLYTSNPRDRGLRYNAVVAEQQSRDALGWRIDTNWRADNDRIEVSVFDAAGQPLTGARVFVEFVRPVEKRSPLGVAMAEIGSGRYASSVTLPARGNWELDIVIERGADHFAQTRRMFLR